MFYPLEKNTFFIVITYNTSKLELTYQMANIMKKCIYGNKRAHYYYFSINVKKSIITTQLKSKCKTIGLYSEFVTYTQKSHHYFE